MVTCVTYVSTPKFYEIRGLIASPYNPLLEGNSLCTAVKVTAGRRNGVNVLSQD